MGVSKFGFEEAKRKAGSGASVLDDDQILELLAMIGEEMCNHARDITPGHATGGYDDQTGNLRSSIGFRIYKDGEPLRDGGFKTVGGAPEGEDEAHNALERWSVAHDVPMDGWHIVIVAGMDYAGYVEAKGYNVLHLTGIELKKKIEEKRKKYGI